MKKSFICTLLLSLTAAAFGQIKMTDESFKTKLETIDLMSQPFSLDEMIPAYEPFKYRILGGYCNEIGQKYLLRGEDNDNDGLVDTPFLKIDNNARKAEIVHLPINTYATITGMIISKDMLEPLCDSVKKYIGVEKFVSWRDGDYSKEQKEVSDFFDGVYTGITLRYIIERQYRWEYSRVVLYKFEDESHNEYFMKRHYERLEPHWVSVSEYEALVDFLKGQKVAIYTSSGSLLHDAYTGNSLTNVRRSSCPPLEKYSKDIYFDYTCTDIILNGEDYLAVLENDDSRFTLKIEKIREVDQQNGDFHQMMKRAYFDEFYYIYPESEYKRINRLFAQTAAERKQLAMQAEARSKAQEQKRQQDIINRYGTTYGNYIIKHQVALGMTREMCREAWGRPLSQTSVKNDFGVSEVWTYGFGYLLFSNGKLTEITQTK